MPAIRVLASLALALAEAAKGGIVLIVAVSLLI